MIDVYLFSIVLKKMERERLEKQKKKAELEKTDKPKSDKVKILIPISSSSFFLFNLD